VMECTISMGRRGLLVKQCTANGFRQSRGLARVICNQNQASSNALAAMPQSVISRLMRVETKTTTMQTARAKSQRPSSDADRGMYVLQDEGAISISRDRVYGEEGSDTPRETRDLATGLPRGGC
jgi:hypothetical protein